MLSSRFCQPLLLCSLAAVTGLPARAASPQATSLPSRVAPDFAAMTGKVPVIIQYITAPTAAELQTLTTLGGTAQVVLKSIHAVQVTLPTSALSTLNNDTNIRYVSPDRQLATHSATTTSSIATSPEYFAEPINAPAVWSQGYSGNNIGVAVIDSGIANSRDFAPTSGYLSYAYYGSAGRVVYSACFTPNCGTDTYDHYGHGTHVAGLIGGNGAASTGAQFFRTFKGVAPAVNLINLKVLDSNGQGSDFAVIQALDAAITLKTVYNIRVINLSLGRPMYESYKLDPLCQAVEAAWNAGIVVVAAAGNAGRDLALNLEGYGTVEAPGNDPYVITVGAVRSNGTATVTDDAMASYSSKGPSFIDLISKPDIVAPGNLVTSVEAGGNTLQQNNPTFFTPVNFYFQYGNTTNSSPDYMPLSGTSMATGVTSGAVALLLNSNSALTPDQVKSLLMLTANKSVLPTTSTVTDQGMTYTAHNDVFTVGAGYLDIASAVRNSKTTVFPAGTAMSPTAYYDPATGNVGLVTDSTALWGRSATWAATSVYGNSAFVGGSTALWGRDATTASTALWGRDDPQAFTALWGATALWGRATPDAATALWGRSSTDASSTALWGASTNNGSTALWSATTFAAQ